MMLLTSRANGKQHTLQHIREALLLGQLKLQYLLCSLCLTHLTSGVLFPKKISTINQVVHQKLEPPELRLVKTRKKSHGRIRRYRRLDFTTVFTT